MKPAIIQNIADLHTDKNYFIMNFYSYSDYMVAYGQVDFGL